MGRVSRCYMPLMGTQWDPAKKQAVKAGEQAVKAGEGPKNPIIDPEDPFHGPKDENPAPHVHMPPRWWPLKTTYEEYIQPNRAVPKRKPDLEPEPEPPKDKDGKV